jgi:uncharacterized protein
MSVYADTSALYAILDQGDTNHRSAGQIYRQLLGQPQQIITNNYVLVEAISLLQNRLGLSALGSFTQSIAPTLQVEWIDQAQHAAIVQILLAANQRQVSIVDCAGFFTMRRLGITVAFVFDKHFEDQGFTCLR